jgi:hypothetical protein
MKNKNFTLYLLLIIGLSSCSAFRTQKIVSNSSKTMPVISPNIFTTPVVADLKISDKKVSAQTTGIAATPKKIRSVTANLKIDAVADEIKKNDCDVLVEPVYTVVSEGSSISVTVTGYPAKYSNFRNYTPADSNSVKLRNSNSVEQKTSTAVLDKKGKAIYWVTGVIAYILLMVIIIP